MGYSKGLIVEYKGREFVVIASVRDKVLIGHTGPTAMSPKFVPEDMVRLKA